MALPAVVDLAAMRALGGDPERINPLSSVELAIDLVHAGARHD